jgi:hypothetical protein
MAGVSFNFIAQQDPSFSKAMWFKSDEAFRRVNVIAGLTEYFHDFYLRRRVTHLVATLEDDVVSLAAYYAARRGGVRVIGLVSGRFPRSGWMLAENFDSVYAWNQTSEYPPQLGSLYRDETISGEETEQRTRSYWAARSIPRRLLGLSKLARYDRYARAVRGALPIEPLIFLDFGGGNTVRAVRSYIRSVARLALMRRYCRNPNAGEKYFLFPLHYTEDAQVTVREPFLDQIALVTTISRALPEGYRLYVKPHPHYLGTDLQLGGILALTRFRNVTVLNPRLRPVPLIRGSAGVITVNSTTGFEAMVMGVEVVSLGHDFYCRDDLCHLVRDLAQLPLVLQNVADGENRRDQGKIIEFASQVYANTIWTEGKQYDYGFSGFSDSDGRKLAAALDVVLGGAKHL